MSAAGLPKKGLKKRGPSVGRGSDTSVTDVAYRPATVEELNTSLTKRREDLQELHEGYKEAKVRLRDAVLKYRRTGVAADKVKVLEITEDISNDYFSQANPLNSIHILKYNPSNEKNNIESVPTKGYIIRDLLFEHYRATKIPEDVGILTYPEAYPAEWFFKPKVEVVASAAPAALGDTVGFESKPAMKGGSDEPKKQLSSRQIGAIIAARKAGRF